MAITVSKPNLVDQDNPTNPQANVFGGAGLQGSNRKVQGSANLKPLRPKVTREMKPITKEMKSSLAKRLNQIIGGN